MLSPFELKGDIFSILDQRELPFEERWIDCSRAGQVVDAIKTLAVRGAPAIGIAAAFGLSLEAVRGMDALDSAAEELVRARPTAVNLSWAVERVLKKVRDKDPSDLLLSTRAEAYAIWEEEKEANIAMAELGESLFNSNIQYTILTHCNTGTLATGGIGTALGIIRKLHSSGKLKEVFVDETRPLLQGARLTAYELMKDDIPCTLITDSMAGFLMRQSMVDAVIVGADRIANNLDVANKIGTYTLAVLANAHNIPFYVAAPMSTFDEDTKTGDGIPLEERDPGEVLGFGGRQVAPEVNVYNPAFDVTPKALITAIITETRIFI